MWVTLLDYILRLRRWVFSLWTFLSCGRDKEHTNLCVLIIPQEQAYLRVLARPGRFVPTIIPREQGKIVAMSKFVCLRDFSKNPQGSTQYPLFGAAVLAISPSWSMRSYIVCVSSTSEVLQFPQFQFPQFHPEVLHCVCLINTYNVCVSNQIAAARPCGSQIAWMFVVEWRGTRHFHINTALFSRVYFPIVIVVIGMCVAV